jgi:hypothetical protein
LKLIPRLIDGIAKVAQCNARESAISELKLGYVSFSAGAVMAGCNPWLVDCGPASAAERSLWESMRTFYKDK